MTDSSFLHRKWLIQWQLLWVQMMGENMNENITGGTMLIRNVIDSMRMAWYGVESRQFQLKVLNSLAQSTPIRFMTIQPSLQQPENAIIIEYILYFLNACLAMVILLSTFCWQRNLLARHTTVEHPTPIELIMLITLISQCSQWVSSVVNSNTKLRAIIAKLVKQKKPKMNLAHVLQMRGALCSVSLKYSLTAFQYKKPTVKIRQFNKLMKMISLHLYHRLILFSPALRILSLYIRNSNKENNTVANRDSWQIRDSELMISLRLWLLVSYISFQGDFIRMKRLQMLMRVLVRTINSRERLMSYETMSQQPMQSRKNTWH